MTDTLTLAPTGYVVSDDYAIWAIGLTPAEAWADLAREMQANGVAVVSDREAERRSRFNFEAGSYTRRSAFSITPATAALLAQVSACGGALGWGIVGGVFCTRSEQDGEAV